MTTSFTLYVEPVELERTNPWKTDTTVAVGLGQWSGGAIGGTEEAVLFIGDGSRHMADAHLSLTEVRALISHLSDVAEAMEDAS